MEPMNPYERRIIHSAISSMEGVRSESKGEGRDRRVVIYSTDPDASNLPDRDNARNARGSRRSDRRGHGGPRREGRDGRSEHGGRGGRRYGGPRSSVPPREFADRPYDPDAKPMAPRTTERIHDGDEFAFGKIEL